ncbi:MAG: hypothetical protein ACRDJ2_13770 [Actinomycetota bacterium]
MSVPDEAVERASVWRTGRKVGRTIYEQRGLEPSDDDVLIGMMDTPQLARRAVGVMCSSASAEVRVADYRDEDKAGEEPGESWEAGFDAGWAARNRRVVVDREAYRREVVAEIARALRKEASRHAGVNQGAPEDWREPMPPEFVFFNEAAEFVESLSEKECL